MNGVDYTKQLAKDREYFRDTAQKTKQASEKLVSDTNDRADHVMEKQKNTFVEDKAELESSYQKNLDHLKDKTTSSIDSMKEKKRQELERAREEFSHDSSVNRKDFDQRLKDIKSSYGKSSESLEALNSHLHKTKDKKYSRNVQDLIKTQEKQMDSYQQKLAGAGSGLKDQFRREKSQLVRANEDNVQNLKNENFKQENAIKDKLGTLLNKTKEVNETEKEILKDHLDEKMNTAQKTFDERASKMAHDYPEKLKKISASQHEETIKDNKAHQNSLEIMQKNFNKQFRAIETEKRRKEAGGSGLAGIMSDQSANKDVNVQKNRVKDLQQKLENTRMTYHNKAVDEEREHFKTLKDQSLEATTLLDKKTNELVADRLQVVEKERSNSLEKLTHREEQNTLTKASYEQQLAVERNQANERLTNLKQNFNKSMKSMEVSSKLNLEDVTTVANEDKSEFIKRVTTERSKELYSMKREFDKSMDLVVEGYEQRIQKLQRDNESLKTTMEQRIQSISSKKDKELETQQKLADGRRTAEANSNRLVLDQREHKLRSSLNQLSSTFQQKMDVMQANNDTKLKLLTDDYESKLKELTVSKTKELSEKEMSQAVAVERLKQIYEDEKARLINGFENQIQSMKVSFKDQMDQQKDLKRIS
ncbi:MAG TPA: hypothetical protein VNJ01_16545 [Bacteriovoracaceae bacterium]|nr:hypothetical protein [Bacteriovoracaceae bacterium]